MSRKEPQKSPTGLRLHAKLMVAALGITGTVMLAPVVGVGVLSAMGFTSTGVASGSLAAFTQSITYGATTGGLFSVLQSAGATLALPSGTTMITGTAVSGAALALANRKRFIRRNGEPVTKVTKFR